MDRHIVLLGSLHIAYGGLGLLASFVVLFGVVGGGWLSQDPEAIRITSYVGTVVSAFLFAVFLPQVLGGIFLLQRRSWARILIIVIGAVNLVNIPIGTALGVYTIWVLTGTEASRQFVKPAEAGAS